LQSSIVAPDFFKAAVGIVGVYDFSLMYTAGDIRGRFSGRRYLEKALGKNEAEFAEFSPVRRVAELKAPVLLIQGEKDERAPVKHSDVLAQRLAAKGHPHEYVVMPNEGHGFYKPENRVRYYQLFLAFFDRHLKR
jgi:dipeptidyl aminopeptidase/acylaminoacyl peptidase